MSNGLVFPHDDVCNFQSQHGHNAKTGYFRIDAMPYRVIIHLLKGGKIKIIDATRRHKLMTDAQKFGISTWCLVFNRAIRFRNTKVCDWQTREMSLISKSKAHKPLVNSIRKLEKYYGNDGPLIIGDKVRLICKQGFIADDNPRRIREIICQSS